MRSYIKVSKCNRWTFCTFLRELTTAKTLINALSESIIAVSNSVLLVFKTTIFTVHLVIIKMYLFLFFIFWLPQQSPNWFWYKRKLCWKNILTKLPSSIQVHYNTLIKWHMIWWCCTTFLVTIASGFLMNFPFFYAHCMCFINAYISMISYLTTQERDLLGDCLLFKCRKCWAKNDIKRI